MDMNQVADGNSIGGTLTTVILFVVSFTDIEVAAKIFAAVAAGAAGITTAWYTILKIKKLKKD